MLKYLQAIIASIFQLFYSRGVMLVAGSAAAMALSGCATTQPDPVVITKIQVVAPADNLMVDCDVAPPPSRETYLQPTPGINPNQTLQKDDAFYLAQYAKTIQALKERERLLTELVLTHYKNLDACNKRWAKLREWKATATEQLSKPQKE